MDKEQQYRELYAKAEQDKNVIGLALTGGRGKGVFTERSDYDVLVVVKDEAKQSSKAEYEKFNSTEIVEASVCTLDELRNKGKWGSEESWAMYGLTHLKAQIDKTGDIQKILDEKGIIPANEIEKYVNHCIDGFINQYYRAIKNHRDGNSFAAHLDATESVPMLLSLLFGREGRIRPYNKFLEWELRNYPLKYLPWSPEEFLRLTEKTLKTGDIETMKVFFIKLRDTSVQLGFVEAVNGWNGYVLE